MSLAIWIRRCRRNTSWTGSKDISEEFTLHLARMPTSKTIVLSLAVLLGRVGNSLCLNCANFPVPNNQIRDHRYITC